MRIGGSSSTSRVALPQHTPLPQEGMPGPVKKAYDKWAALARKYTKASADVKHAEDGIREAAVQDRCAIKEAAAAGKSLEGVGRAVEEARRAKDLAERQRDGLLDAVDEAGTACALAVAANADEYVAALEGQEQQAVQKYVELIEEARALLPAIAAARDGLAFLGAHDFSLAARPKSTYLFTRPAGRVLVDTAHGGTVSATQPIDDALNAQYREGKHPLSYEVIG